MGRVVLILGIADKWCQFGLHNKQQWQWTSQQWIHDWFATKRGYVYNTIEEECSLSFWNLTATYHERHWQSFLIFFCQGSCLFATLEYTIYSINVDTTWWIHTMWDCLRSRWMDVLNRLYQLPIHASHFKTCNPQYYVRQHDSFQMIDTQCLCTTRNPCYTTRQNKIWIHVIKPLSPLD